MPENEKIDSDEGLGLQAMKIHTHLCVEIVGWDEMQPAVCGMFVAYQNMKVEAKERVGIGPNRRLAELVQSGWGKEEGA